MTVEQVWWVLFTVNVLLTAYLVYKERNLKKKYMDKEDYLHEHYKMLEGDLLEESDKYFQARREYEILIKNLKEDGNG